MGAVMVTMVSARMLVASVHVGLLFPAAALRSVVDAAYLVFRAPVMSRLVSVVWSASCLCSLPTVYKQSVKNHNSHIQSLFGFGNYEGTWNWIP